MFKNKLLFGILSLCLLSMECEDLTEPEGVETRVYGRVLDQVDELPKSNFKVRISEYNALPGWGQNEEFIQFLDSTVTDLQGYYDLTFKTSGLGDTYYLEGIGSEDIRLFDPYYEIEDLGIDSEINISYLQLYPVELKITFDETVELSPMNIWSSYTNFRNTVFENNGIEETRLIYVFKDAPFDVIFSRTIEDTIRQQIFYEFPATNTTETTVLPILITDEDFVTIN